MKRKCDRGAFQRPPVNNNSSSSRELPYTPRHPTGKPLTAVGTHFYSRQESTKLMAAGWLGNVTVPATACADFIDRIYKQPVGCMGQCGLVFSEPPDAIMVATDFTRPNKTFTSGICHACMVKHQDNQRQVGTEAFTQHWPDVRMGMMGRG